MKKEASDPDARLVQLRESISPDGISVERSWATEWAKVRNLKIIPNHILADDVVLVPIELVAPNAYHENFRKIDYLKALPNGWSRDEPRAELALRRLKRIALLDFMLTVKAKHRRVEPAKAHIWVRRVQYLVLAARVALSFEKKVSNKKSLCPDGSPIFRDLTPVEFDLLRAEVPSLFHTFGSRLNALFGAGVFDDWPANDVAGIQYARVPIKPLSDGAFSEILKASFFLGKIQGDLEQCYLYLSKFGEDGAVNAATRNNQLEMLRNWRGTLLEPGMPFPYSFDLRSGRSIQPMLTHWPVQSLRGLKSFLRLCQTANLQIVATETAARSSELKLLPRSPIKQINGRSVLVGSTFKESEALNGTPRHWPLTKHAVNAVARQRCLLNTMASPSPYLWTSWSTSGTGLAKIEGGMRTFGKSVRLLNGVPLDEIDGVISPHRFRKTMSRLVGLALEGASGVLYDVLGHSDIETTLGYMLSDPEFQDDAEQVRHEVRNVRRKEVMQELDSCGGPAAQSLRFTRDELRARSVSEDLGDYDIELLSTLLPTLEQVGPNRYCTAESRQTGLCSKVAGQRDIAACSSSCLYRLERAAAKKDLKDAVQVALELLSGEVNQGLRSFYQGQIISNLGPFEDMIDDFLDDPRLVHALKDRVSEDFTNLPSTVRSKLGQILEADCKRGGR